MPGWETTDLSRISYPVITLQSKRYDIVNIHVQTISVWVGFLVLFLTSLILGPEDLEPKCLSKKKNRSQDHSINESTATKLGRFYKALKPDLDDLVGPYQFADWTYDEYLWAEYLKS